MEPFNLTIRNMLESNQYEKFSIISKLFKVHPKSLGKIFQEFDIYIKKRCNSFFQNQELSKNKINLISQLIKLKSEMDKLVEGYLEKDKNFQDLIDKTFNFYMKKDFYAKILSNYIDFCMRIGFKDKSKDEVEETIKDIIRLFRCLNSKTIFLFEIKKKLSERLLKKLSLSIFYEQIFISKLRQEAGLSYVSKMQEMMSDLIKNEKEAELYKSLKNRGIHNCIKLDITVISENAWEINKKYMEKMIIPKFLSSCLDDFENFYLNKYKNQKLIWCLGLSKVEIQYLYLNNQNISISTLPQLISLLLLEQKGELSLGTIAQMLGCKERTIINDIQGLIYNPSFNPHAQADKGIILSNFNRENKEFKETDVIKINEKFICSKIKFNTFPLKQKQLKSESNEEKENEKIIQTYQNNIIQSTITRIMKSKIGQKTSHSWLLSEVAKQIDLFNVQPQQIKENIEKLLEKGVIKRSDEERSCYEYIA